MLNLTSGFYVVIKKFCSEVCGLTWQQRDNLAYEQNTLLLQLTGVVQIIPTFHLDNVFLQSSGWLLSASVLPGPALFSPSTKSLCFSYSLGQEHLSLTGSLLPQTLTTLLFRYVGRTKLVRIPLCSVIQALSSPGQFCQSSPLSYLSSVMEHSVSYSA